MNEKYLITKILNNNCMIIDMDGTEKLFLGKGVAFGKKNGEYCAVPSEVDKIFVIEEKRNVADYQQLLDKNDEIFVSFCEDLIWELSRQVQTELNERIHVSLIDHLACTIRRLRLGEQIINPFLQETETLYRREFILAKKICNALEKQYQIKIPEGETGFVAIHIHSAMYNGDLRDALKSNRICSRVLRFLESELRITIDRRTLDCSRFMVHLTYLIKRIQTGQTAETGLGEMADLIIHKYPESYRLSKETARILNKEIKKAAISEEEMAFLTMHIERLSQSVGRSADNKTE